MLPSVAGVDIVVAAPPQVRSEQGGRRRWPAIAGVLLAVGVLVAMVVTGSISAHGPGFAMFPILMVVSALASLGYGMGAGRSAELDADRDDYLAYLDELAVEFIETAARQRDREWTRHPAPDALWCAAADGARWHSGGEDPEPGSVRIGLGTVAAERRPVRAEPADHARRVDPVTDRALTRFLEVHSALSEAPVTVDLFGASMVSVIGASGEARALLRAVVCQVAAANPPGRVLIVAAVSDAARVHWSWLKWLPHHRHPTICDERGPASLRFHTLSAALRTVDGDRRLLVIADGVEVSPDDIAVGVTVLTTAEVDFPNLRLIVDGDSLLVDLDENETIRAAPDAMSASDAEACARRLAAVPVPHAPRRPGTGWLDMFGIHSLPELTAAQAWLRRRELRIPIGYSDDGEPVELDIKEAAQQGMGPHGLCIGATGSGKSELLRTIALGMVAGHSPEELNLILVDFKGGATFLGMDGMRHVSAVITNLADEAHLVDRMQDALTGEINRRQRVLREAGNLGGIADYRRARVGRPHLVPLPTLFVIVDEFSELLSHHPEFADTFAAIGRLGRSLGIHLLLASQRIDEGRLRGLDSHLSYRICLKTLSAGESRAVIGVPDAYELTTEPGAAYLKVGAADPVRFRAAYVSGPVPRSVSAAPTGGTVPVEFRWEPMPECPITAPSAAGTVIDTVLAKLSGQGPAAHAVWLAPLTTSPTLDEVLSAHPPAADLRVPIGVVDRVYEQRRAPMTVDLAGAAGNVAIVGAPQSGKSAALRTLALALACAHHPSRIQMYCLDFGGGGLTPLRHIPHVGCIASRRDGELQARAIAEVTALLRRREELFTRHGIDSIAEYRRQRAAGRCDAGDPFGDVFLMVDGWAALRQEHDAHRGMEAAITTLAAEGLSLGIHVWLTASRWADLRPALKDQIGTRIELRLADPLDSEIDRRAARNVPAGRPGRGLSPDGNPLTVALPRLDGLATDSGLADAAQSAAATLAARYPDAGAPPIRLLPARVDLTDVRADHRVPEGTVLLGIDDQRFEPIALNFAEQPHLLVLGDRGCGKTAALRALLLQLDPRSRRIVVDPRRTMAGVTGVEHLTTAAGLTTVLDSVCNELALRASDSDQTAAPAVYLVVDDYELIADAVAHPLGGVLQFLSRARDIGLHIIIARCSAGAARALYEPVLVAVRECDAFGLQMSSGAEDVPLFATGRPRTLPPGRAILVDRAVGERVVQVVWT